SFNPLHAGHVELARIAEERLSGPVAFELAVLNADKPPLRAAEVRHRLAQFAWRQTVELTRAATFREKAHLLPGVTFVVGADTAERIVQPRYYGDRTADMLAALDEIARHGCRFLVAGRTDDQGRIVALSKNPQLFSSAMGGHQISYPPGLEFNRATAAIVGNMIGMDPPEHNAYRRLVSPSFSASAVRKMEPTVREIVTRILDRVVP